MPVWRSKKEYTPEDGISAVFRQRNADSHCKYLHGYALGFVFWWEALDLDACNWVVDFGACKSLLAVLKEKFDHHTMMDKDDPHSDWYHEGVRRGLIQLTTLNAVGCEKFAEFAANQAMMWLDTCGYAGRVRVYSVECYEHRKNSALYMPDPPPGWGAAVEDKGPRLPGF